MTSGAEQTNMYSWLVNNVMGNEMSDKMKESLFVWGWTAAIGVVLFAVPIYMTYLCGVEMGVFH